MSIVLNAVRSAWSWITRSPGGEVTVERMAERRVSHGGGRGCARRKAGRAALRVRY